MNEANSDLASSLEVSRASAEGSVALSEMVKRSVANMRDAFNGVLTPNMSNAVRMCLANVSAYGKPQVRKAALATGLSPRTVSWAWGQYRHGKMKLAEVREKELRDIRKFGMERDVALHVYYSGLLERLATRLAPAVEAALRKGRWDVRDRESAVFEVKQYGEVLKEMRFVRKVLEESKQAASVIGSTPQVLVQTNVHHANGRTETRVEAIEQNGGSVTAAFLEEMKQRQE